MAPVLAIAGMVASAVLGMALCRRSCGKTEGEEKVDHAASSSCPPYLAEVSEERRNRDKQ